MADLILHPAYAAERERRYRKLLAAPHCFSNEEFHHLLEVEFADRLDRYQQWDLMCRRIIHPSYGNTAEHQLLRAIILGDHSEAERLQVLLRHRKTRHLKLVHGTPGNT